MNSPVLYTLFENSALRFPDRIALKTGTDSFTYAELKNAAESISGIIPNGKSEVVSLLAHRSLSAYAGVLGILGSGKAYVPLNPNFPSGRNLNILEQCGTDILIIGKECLPAFVEMSGQVSPDILLCFPDSATESLPTEITEKFRILETRAEKNTTAQTSLAYILFTSGSTGVPKGVPVKQSSVADYVKHILQTFNPGENDKFSQTFDLTFDLSVHDMFVCWACGAALCVPSDKALFAPAKFIRENEITWWFSVPSVAIFMDGFRMLKAGSLPSLKYSMFCGEALPLAVVQKWRAAAPGSEIVNIYGPTEATIGISHYALPQDDSQIIARNHIVSIGKIFPGQKFRVMDENGKEQTTGELWLGGSQISDGYWQNPDKSAEVFVTNGNGEKWYRTGDEVELLADGMLNYIGRLDFQVKIHGYRVELGEVNKAISEITGITMVHSIAWPVKDGIAEGIHSFISNNCPLTKEAILSQLKIRLPEYMVPKNIHFLQNFPVNSNGKTDQKQLARLIS